MVMVNKVFSSAAAHARDPCGMVDLDLEFGCLSAQVSLCSDFPSWQLEPDGLQLDAGVKAVRP